MRLLIVFISTIYLSSCTGGNQLKVQDLKKGSFRTVLDNNSSAESVSTRNDSVQIELYKGKKDTFYINWVDKFEYILIKKNPKNLLDSTPFHVKITGIKDRSYTFKAYYKGSKFIQQGKAFKLE